MNVLSKKRPFSVTILIMIVLFLMLSSSLRIFAIAQNWNILIMYNAQPGPIYMIVSSFAWLIISTILLVSIIKRTSGTPILTYAATGLFIIWYWIDRIIFQHRENGNLFPIIGTCIMIILIFLILNHRDSKIYF